MEFNIADLWEAVVDAVPDREALVHASERMTFREVDERANRLAHYLAERGIGHNDHVAVYLRNRPEYIETMLAAFKLRAVPINVNYRYVAKELQHLLTDANVKAAVVDREFLPVLNEILESLPLLATVVVVGAHEPTPEHGEHGHDQPAYAAVLAASSPERGFAPRSGDDLYIVYTGGTTGMPKGVLWRSEDIFFAGIGGGNPGGEPIQRPEQIVDHLDRPIRGLPACPLMHGTANWFATRILFGGGTVILSSDPKFDPVRTWEFIARERANFLVIVGDAFAQPLVEALGHLAPGTDVSCLRWVLSSGALFSASVKASWLERMPQLKLIDGFGSTETGAQGQAITALGAETRQAEFVLSDDMDVLDDRGRRADPGVIGRLARRGRIPIGYYKDPVKTAATFPVIDGVRWSIPGDHAVRGADGTITVLGRGAVSINTGGEKVFPEEVEEALKSHPDVLDALVVGIPDSKWGERVVAVVSPTGAVRPSLEELGDHARLSVASYKVPRSLAYVDAITRTAAGKPDYAWAQRVALEHAGSED